MSTGPMPMLDELARAAAAAQREPQVQQLPFAPVPTQLSVLQANAAGREWVLLVVQTPQGQQGYFLEPETARQVAGFLANTAAAAASGLTVVGTTGTPPATDDGVQA